jgi:hypothetical protein
MFGEFLVQQQILDRYQLFLALQLQDKVPGARLGQCAVALGFAPRERVESLHIQFVGDGLDTEAFSREPIEIIPDRSPAFVGRARAITRAC